MSCVLSSGVRSMGSYRGEICAVHKKHHREPMKGAGMIGPMHKCKHCRSCLLSLPAPAMWKSKWEKQNALSLGNDGAISKFQNRNVFLFLNLILVRLLSLLCFFFFLQSMGEGLLMGVWGTSKLIHDHKVPPHRVCHPTVVHGALWTRPLAIGTGAGSWRH